MKLTSLNATTEVLMENGSYKKLKDIKPNEKVALGGTVLNIKKVNDSDLYLYDNSITQGDQAVFENDKWVLVRNSKKSSPFKEKAEMIFIETKNHLLVTKNRIWYDILGCNNLDYKIEVLNQNKPNNEKLIRFLNEYFEDEKNKLKEIKTPF
jgi:hypothetical protein